MDNRERAVRARAEFFCILGGYRVHFPIKTGLREMNAVKRTIFDDFQNQFGSKWINFWKNRNALPSSLGKIKVIQGSLNISFSEIFSRYSVLKPDDLPDYLEMYIQYLLPYYWMERLRFSIVSSFLFSVVFLILISGEESTLRSQKETLE